ncbi:MAG: hypothetical protein R6U31_07140 [bacterium]
MRIIGSERMLDFNYITEESTGLMDLLVSDVNAAMYNSGRSASYCLFKSLKSPSLVLFPDFYCPSMLQPLKEAGHETEFYHIGSDFTADIESIKPFAEQADIIYITDYFGFRDNALLEFLDKKDIRTVIDRTHSILSVFDSAGDCELGSFRKILPVPDGGYFTGCADKCSVSEKPSIFPFIKTYAKILRYMHEKTDGGSEIENYYVKYSTEGERMISCSPSGISPLSSHIISHYPLRESAADRRRNYNYLYSELKQYCPLQLSSQSVPQSMPIMIEKRNKVKLMLQQKGIYAPVLWRCGNPISDNLLNLPCDEEYSIDDMKRIIVGLRECGL